MPGGGTRCVRLGWDAALDSTKESNDQWQMCAYDGISESVVSSAATPDRWSATDTAKAAGLTAAYVATGRLGLALGSVDGVATAVWPPTGLSLAAVLLFGPRLWPGVACGALLVNLSVGVPVLAALGIAAGNTLEAVLGAWALRSVGFRHSLDRVQDVVALVVVAALLSTLVSATVGTSSAWLAGVVPSANFTAAWLTWWMGDAVGDLVVAPALLVWSTPATYPRRRAEYVELAVLLALLGVVCSIIFREFQRPVTWVVFPFVVWAGLRYRQAAMTAVVALTAGIAVWMTAANTGPFAGMPVTLGLLLSQMYLSVLSVTGLLFAAAMEERRVAGQTLYRREAHFRALIDKSHDAIALLDAAGTLTFVSPSATRIHGAAIAPGQPLVDLVHPDDRQRIAGLLAEVVAEAGRVRLAECRVWHRDGTWHWADGAATNLLEDPSVQAVVINYRDVTARKQAEEKLRSAREQLRLVTNSMAAAVARCSRDLRYIWVSRAYAAWLGHLPEAIAGRPIVEIVGTEGMRAIQPHIERVLRGEVVRYDAAVNYLGVGERWIDAVYTPTLDATGAVDGWVAAVTDISDRKATEAALQSARDDLEIRVLERTAELRSANEALAELSGRLQVFQDDERRRVARQLYEGSAQNLAVVAMHLAQIQQAAQGLNARAQQALAESAALTGQTIDEIRAIAYRLHPPLLDEVGLASAVRWYLDGLRKRTGITVEVTIAPDLGRFSWKKERALFRVIQECLAHVPPHAEAARIRVEIARTAEQVSVRIEDTGSGVVRDRFGTLAVLLAGSGLGVLSLRERLRHLSGFLDVRSGSRGTVVEATLPIDD
jgi:PAS domain S-box-containing protein